MGRILSMKVFIPAYIQFLQISYAIYDTLSSSGYSATVGILSYITL